MKPVNGFAVSGPKVYSFDTCRRTFVQGNNMMFCTGRPHVLDAALLRDGREPPAIFIKPGR